jgi:6-phospho-3-hexuloisomerase
MMPDSFKEKSSMILNECGSVFSRIDSASIGNLVEEILKADKVFFVGVGRVLIALQAAVKRFNHLGIPAFYVGQIDEPPITPDDLLIVGSGSGESLYPVAIAQKARKIGARIAYIGSNPDSTIKQNSDLFVRIPVPSKMPVEDTVISQQPMTSLFEQCLFLLGDVLALMIMEEKRLGKDDLNLKHANLE